MSSKQDVNSGSTMNLVDEESMERCLGENRMVSRAEEGDDSKIVMAVGRENPTAQLKKDSGNLSAVNKGQIIMSLGIWVCSIVGLSKADEVNTVHVTSLLSTAMFISAGYIGIQTIRKPRKFRALLYVGLCTSSFIFGIVMVVICTRLFVGEFKGTEILIAEIVFYTVEIILAPMGILLIRRTYTAVFASRIHSSVSFTT